MRSINLFLNSRIVNAPNCLWISWTWLDKKFIHICLSIKKLTLDRYSSNISRCVKLKERKISGMKSHDNHILMQQLFPIAIHESLPPKVSKSLIDLSCFFREICSKVLNVEELGALKKRIAVTLCELERIFHPSFFTVMVHLVMHLASETKVTKVAGLVHYR